MQDESGNERKTTIKRRHRQEDFLLDETRTLLRRFGLRARKGLGQHFLIDKGVLEVIAAAAGLEPEDIVIEIGPGLGVLTRELGRRVKRVVAVELDTKLATLLRQQLFGLQFCCQAS